MVKGADPEDGDSWEGPIKKLVEPLADKIIMANKDVTQKIAQGDGTCADGGGFYPMNCVDGASYESCGGKFGLIKCDEHKDCPAFFQKDASAKDDKVSGGVVFFIAICILFTCLLGLVMVLQKMLLGMSTRIVYKATDVNGYVAIVIGACITIVVQSSSITTSTLTPLVGMGALRLEQMLPLTLGANIGTTMTALMSAMVSEGTAPLQVALAHLFFNLTGIAIWYPIPFMRSFPLHAARQLGKCTRIWRGFPLAYIGVMFILIPMLFLGLSSLFSEGNKGYTVLGTFLTIILGLVVAWSVYWYRFSGGQESCVNCMTERERKRVALEELPDDMQELKAKLTALVEHTGLLVDEKDEEASSEELEA
jgi:sodium-dependent phosphate cotransporter